MPVLSKICAYTEAENIQITESKTFNNMSPTTGFDYSYSQYMSSIFLLRTCYELLEEAGFKNIAKNEDEQSLTIWGLKLFFVNIAGFPNIINIAGPGIDFLYKRNKQYANGENEPPSSSLGTLSERHNHFLQYSIIDCGNVYRREGAMYVENQTQDCSGLECANEFYKNTDDDGNIEYMLYVTLRCSNDGICFSTQIYNERLDVKGYQYPLFNIFKGKDLLNNKDILVLGKKIERVPFVFSTPYYNVKYALSSQDNMLQTSNINSSALQALKADYTPNFNLFNGQINFYGNRYGSGRSQKANHAYITASLDSALVCSGNNLIYYTDDTYTQLEDTLYLDWKYSIADNIVTKSNAIGNSGKYEVYGINEVLIDIPVQSNYYYDIGSEKYWCMFNHLITRYTSFREETDTATLKLSVDTNYFNEVYSHKGFFQSIGYSQSGSNEGIKYGISVCPTLDYLNSYANSFGKMKLNYYEDPEGVTNAKKKAVPVALNPAFLMRIDDVITE